VGRDPASAAAGWLALVAAYAMTLAVPGGPGGQTFSAPRGAPAAGRRLAWSTTGDRRPARRVTGRRGGVYDGTLRPATPMPAHGRLVEPVRPGVHAVDRARRTGWRARRRARVAAADRGARVLPGRGRWRARSCPTLGDAAPRSSSGCRRRAGRGDGGRPRAGGRGPAWPPPRCWRCGCARRRGGRRRFLGAAWWRRCRGWRRKLVRAGGRRGSRPGALGLRRRQRGLSGFHRAGGRADLGGRSTSRSATGSSAG